MKHLSIPSVEDLLDKVHPHYPYNKTFATARTDPWVMVYALLYRDFRGLH
jgi:hypothetical protein